MNQLLQSVYLARHGETAWTVSSQHTGRTDLPLTEHGEREAKELCKRLASLPFEAVLVSPLKRAVRTCELAGFGSVAQIDRDLLEWNYGEYEGRLTSDILTERPGWDLFRDGCPGGESPQQVAVRADHAIERVRAIDGDVLLFSSGHFLRILATRWTGLEAVNGRALTLGTASLSILGYERDHSRPAIQLWNETHRLFAESEMQGSCLPKQFQTNEVTR
jgi:broad specificity phosphatase PhoE